MHKLTVLVASLLATLALAGDAPLSLPLVGLTVEMPANSSVSKMMGSQMVQGGGTVFTVKEEKPGKGDKDLAAAKKAAAMYSPLKFTREETLPDGYVIAFENKGGMGMNYFVNVRRTIDGKVYKCETTASTPEQGKKAEAACLSLKKG